MWTFYSANSLIDGDQKKKFWKTTNNSFPLTRPERNITRNMLWRSLQHFQRFNEEKYINMQHFSKVYDLKYHKITSQHLDCFFYNQHNLVKKKARLSKWTLLGHENKYLRKSSNSVKLRSSCQFRKSRKCFYGFIKDKSQPAIQKDNNKNIFKSEYHNCSCEKWADNLSENMSIAVYNQLRKMNMAPNSEDRNITNSSKRNWGTEFANKESLRPPVYNPEDYATSLKKWGKKGNMGIKVPQYLSQSTGSLEKFSEDMNQLNKRQSSPSTKSSLSIKSGDEKHSKKDKELTLKTENKDVKNKENINRGLKSDLQKDFLAPLLSLSTQTEEMSLRQFCSVTELLGKLKVDLKSSFPSFVQEFVGDPTDGVTLLLELLRTVQLSQTSQVQRCPPQILRRALLDEHSCLVCLKHCLRCPDASRRLASSSAGLFTLAVCIMSSVTQSRIIALELLTKACEPQAGGHKAVSEALSTLRLRFGEPVRFRFLVGMLSSAGAIELLAAAMKFINVFVQSAPNLQQKVYIQAELEQAGFDSEMLRKTLPTNSESVKVELNNWDKNYFDVEKLNNEVAEVNVLQDKILLLEKRIKILQEEKGILQSLEQCLKERCSELEEKVNTNVTTAKVHPNKPFRNGSIQQCEKITEREESTPAEDEGISSSEQELSQDEDYVKGIIHYNSSDLKITGTKKNKSAKPLNNEVSNRYLNTTGENTLRSSCNSKNLKNFRSYKMKETNVDDGNEIASVTEENLEEEEETTIDKVIEELENIVNDAETEVYDNEEKGKNVKPTLPLSFPETLNNEEKCQIYSEKSHQEKLFFEESEIIPAILHPQPPKKAKSLIHIYFPESDLDSQCRNKGEFFYDDSDTESSDSLLTAAREKKTQRKGSHKSLEISDSFNSFSSVNTRTLFIKHEQELEINELESKTPFEERNIDEEEIKRKHLKNIYVKCENTKSSLPETKFDRKKIEAFEDNTRNDLSRCNNYERQFPGVKSNFAYNESLISRAPKFVPTPVKRSQTFHITFSEGENFLKKNDIKPKPKMGVSGLDFQRTSEQKMKNEQWKNKVTEYKKNVDKQNDSSERYPERLFQKNKKLEKSDCSLLRRESFTGSFIPLQSNRANRVQQIDTTESSSFLDKPPLVAKPKGIEKVDEGLDSLVDIVISVDENKKVKTKTEWSSEVTKNIGPRTRRSLAESSLFCPQYAKNLNKPQESPKPPKPAARTSLARNNSSSTPLHFPTEIKVAPDQTKPHQKIIYNFGIKSAKSVDSLVACSQTKCSPTGISISPSSSRKQECQKHSIDHSQTYLKADKFTKIQTFFGNPKFDKVPGNEHRNQNYFESNYAQVTKEKPAAVICSKQNHNDKFKSQQQQKAPINDNKSNETKRMQMSSKPNFLLGTYQSSSAKNNDLKPTKNGLVLHSINTFNNNSLLNKTSPPTHMYANSKNNKSEFGKEKHDEISNRQISSNALGSEKVTDSPSGLY